MAYLRSGIDGGRQGSSLIRNRVVDIRGDLATGGRLVLSTTEPTVVDGNELGRIDFQAPLDTAGSDAILVSASIYAEADATFSSTVNNTELVFAVATGTASAEKMRLDSGGQLGIGVATPASLLHVAGTVQVGVDGTGHDVKFFGASASRYMHWDEAADALKFPDSSTIYIGTGNDMKLYHDGTNSYITNAVGALKIATETSGIAVNIGHTTSETTVNDNFSVVGNVVISPSGKDASDAIAGFAPNVQIEGTGATTSALSIFRNSADESSPYLIMGKSRNASVGGDTLIADNDICGSIVWAAADGVDRVSRIAEIRGVIQGTPGANDTPGSLEFLTTADGAQACTAAMEIKADQSVNIRGNITGGINPAGGDLDENHQYASYSYVNADTVNRTVLYRSIQNVSGTGTGGTVAQIQSHQGLGTTAYASGLSFGLYYPWGSHERYRFRGDGNAYAEASWSVAALDFAEYFEWEDGNSEEEYRAGYSVIMVSDGKVRKSTNDDNADDIIGVVSERAGYIGNTAWLEWNEKWLTDDFGKKLTEKEEAWWWQEVDENGKKGETHQYGKNHVPDDVTIPDDAATLDEADVNILNPSYNESLEEGYIPREQRIEWGVIGLLGQIPVRKGQKLNPRWLKIRDISSDVEEYFVR